MSSTDKQGDVAVQKKDDGVPENDKVQNDAKSDSSPQKRSASEVSVVAGHSFHGSHITILFDSLCYCFLKSLFNSFLEFLKCRNDF